MQAKINSPLPSIRQLRNKGALRLSALALIFIVLAAIGFLTIGHENAKAEDENVISNNNTLPYVVNLRPFYRNRFGGKGGFDGFARSQTIDGLPFRIDGQIELFGRTSAERGDRAPKLVSGIKIGRAFDELHLIHDVVWEDPVGQTVAIVRLHYADGKHYDFEIKYGVHVEDWNRLLSEETESLGDDSKIIRHYPGVNKGVGRLFKSVLYNPYPKKIVETMDLISGEGWSSYKLAAATVAKRDPQREVTPGLPLNDPPRHFDGALTVKMEDDKTGLPIANVDIRGFTQVNGEGIVIPPLRTDSHGEAVLKYPIADTANIGFNATKPGYTNLFGNWQSWRSGNIPENVTCRAAVVSQPLVNLPGVSVVLLSVLAASFVILILWIVSLWCLFTKASRPGWASLIPFYNSYILLKIGGKPGWWLILMCIPFVNIVIVILMALGIAENFGKKGGFAVGMILLPIIFYPILAFGDAPYSPKTD